MSTRKSPARGAAPAAAAPNGPVQERVAQPRGPRPRADLRIPPIVDVGGRLRDRGLMEMAENEGRHSQQFDALASELRLTLVSCFESLGAQVHARLQQVGLVSAKFNVLMILRDSATGRLSMGEIAALVLTSPRNVTALVDSLEDAGLVRRHPSRSDRRVTLIGLTRAGEELLDAFLPAFYGAIGGFFESFSEEEKLQVIHGLNKLRVAVAHASDAEQPPAKKPARSAARARAGGRARVAAGARRQD